MISLIHKAYEALDLPFARTPASSDLPAETLDLAAVLQTFVFTLRTSRVFQKCARGAPVTHDMAAREFDRKLSIKLSERNSVLLKHTG
jgi:hypothetical protein